MSPPSRVAIITGASSGIGAALARRLASSGFKVGLIARRLDRLEALQPELGDQAAIAQADVGVRQEIVAAIHELAARLGPVDLLIANAGVGHRVQLNPMNVEEIEKVIRVNLLGVIYSLEAVLPAHARPPFRSSRRHFQRCRLQGHAWRIGLLRQQVRVGALHGRVAHSTARHRYRGHHHQSRLRKKRDDRRPPLPHAVPSRNRRSRPSHLQGAASAKTKVFNFPWQTAFLMRLARFLPDALFARVMPQLPGD